MDTDLYHDGCFDSRPLTPFASPVWLSSEYLLGRNHYQSDLRTTLQPRDADTSGRNQSGNHVEYSGLPNTLHEIDHDRYGREGEFMASNPPTLEAVDSVLAQLPDVRPQPKKLLRKRHKKMSKIRETVLKQREEIQMEYQDLSFRMEEVRVSQEELMNNLDLHDDEPYLRSVWERTKSDMATFMARLERIDQLAGHLDESEARLIVADEDFVVVANATASKAGGISKKAAKSAQQPEPISKIQQEEENRILLSRLETLRTNVSFFKDRLNELEWEQDEELTQRELIYDQGQTPSIPERQFFESYITARDNIKEDLRLSHQEIAQLEATARERGLDTSILSDIQAWSYVSSQADADNGPPPETGGDLDEQQPYSEHAVDTEKRGSGDWSSRSLAGSPRHQTNDRATSIGYWLQNVEPQTEGVGVQVAHDLKRRSTTSFIREIEPRQTLRRRFTMPQQAGLRRESYGQPSSPSFDRAWYVNWQHTAAPFEDTTT